MPDHNQIPIDTLRALLSYDPLTGLLSWKKRIPSFFESGYRSAEGKCNNWNAKMGDQPAFTCLSKGYLMGRIFKRPFKAHRVIWALHYGEWPADDIDHINGVRTDNRISNLRSVTRQENRRNIALSSVNTSGVLGVSWEARRRKWIAVINLSKKAVFLGSFHAYTVFTHKSRNR